MKKIYSAVTVILVCICATLCLFGCGSTEKTPKTEFAAVDDGVFNQTCTFSMDLQYESQIANPLDENSDNSIVRFLVLYSKLLYGDLFNMVNTATQPKQLYDLCDVYFMADGSVYYHTVASYDLREQIKKNASLLYKDMTQEQAYALIDAGEVKVAGYRIENTERENEYTVRTSLQELPELTYNKETGALTCKGKFEKEIYNSVKAKSVPEETKKTFDYSAIPNVGEKEAEYLKNGTYEVESVKYRETDLTSTFYQHKVWYPKELNKTNKKYPLVVMANGTGTLVYGYEYVFEHLASWGFIVIGNDENSSGFGNASEASLKLMLSLNEDKDSVFYGKVDTENIGSAGHSQGGIGAVNAVVRQAHGNMYKAIYSMSASNAELAQQIGWNYDETKIKIPFFAVTGEKEGNTDLDALKVSFDKIDNSVDKLIAMRKNAAHGDMLTYGNGYMTAWFLWHLCGDEQAADAIKEIASNSVWQDV